VTPEDQRCAAWPLGACSVSASYWRAGVALLHARVGVLRNIGFAHDHRINVGGFDDGQIAFQPARIEVVIKPITSSAVSTLLTRL
jgi:hypothetical protein